MARAKPRDVLKRAREELEEMTGRQAETVLEHVRHFGQDARGHDVRARVSRQRVPGAGMVAISPVRQREYA